MAHTGRLFGIRQNTRQRTTTWLASHFSSARAHVCVDTAVSVRVRLCACMRLRRIRDYYVFHSEVKILAMFVHIKLFVRL